MYNKDSDTEWYNADDEEKEVKCLEKEIGRLPQHRRRSTFSGGKSTSKRKTKKKRRKKRKSRRKRRKSRRKLRRKTKMKRKYRKQGGSRKNTGKQRKRHEVAVARVKRLNEVENAARSHQERNDPEQALKKLRESGSIAGHAEIANHLFPYIYKMPTEERSAMNSRMYDNKRFGQKGENEVVDVARVAFIHTQGHPNIPTIVKGQKLFERDIRGLIMCQGLDVSQDKEARRLAARLYLAALDDSDLGLTIQSTTRQQRQAILEQLRPNVRTAANGEKLPLPLQIFRKSRQHQLSFNNDRYPLLVGVIDGMIPDGANGVVDQLHDAFWPRNRQEISDFMKTIPTLEEMEDFGL
jgi:hypothetical protein